MRKFDITLLKYGYTTIEAESEEEALEKIYEINPNDITWEPSEYSDIKEVCPYARERWVNGERFDDICTLSNFICNRRNCAIHLKDKPSNISIEDWIKKEKEEEEKRGLRSSLPLLLETLDEKQLEIVRETIDLILEKSS